MENDKLIIVFLIFVFELYEASWQRGSTFKEYLDNLVLFYKRGVISFLLHHPSFYYMLYLMTATGFNDPLFVFMALFKGLDIAFKLTMVDKIAYNKSLGGYEQLISDDVKMPNYFRYLGVAIYPMVVLFS
jgi:hypothetical protein